MDKEGNLAAASEAERADMLVAALTEMEALADALAAALDGVEEADMEG